MVQRTWWDTRYQRVSVKFEISQNIKNDVIAKMTLLWLMVIMFNNICL